MEPDIKINENVSAETLDTAKRLQDELFNKLEAQTEFGGNVQNTGTAKIDLEAMGKNIDYCTGLAGTKVSSVTIVWDQWSIRQKLVWFWKVKLGFGDWELRAWQQWESACFRAQEQGLDEPPCPMATEKEKFWYCYNPKSTVTMDVTIRPKRAAEFVIFNMTLDQEKKC